MRTLTLGFIACTLLISACAEPKPNQNAVASTQEQAALSNPVLDDALSTLIPKPLSERDAELYEQIFAVQEQGRWDDADRLISRLSDDVLMGHVMAQRYLHPTAYRSRYKELKDWLASYADHPQAPRIYKLALTRRGSANYPKKPVGSYVSGAGYDYENITPYYHKSSKKLSSKQRSRVATLKSRIRHRIGSGWPTGRADRGNTVGHRRVEARRVVAESTTLPKGSPCLQ